ncbi:MAG: hypothetical protein HKL85_06020 [Acidimicrobiaceae bacterium]|nr:hypothetical protein [Acidimicrobiaceae bacterium]
MGRSSEHRGSLDIVAHTAEVGISIGGFVVEGVGVALEGSIFSTIGSIEPLPVIVTIDRESLEEVQFEPLDGGLVLIGEDHVSVREVTNYTAVTALNGRYVIHSGVVMSAQGREADVFAIADPVPIIVVGAGILAAGCLVGGGVGWVIEWFQSNSTGQYADCLARGHYPKVRLEFKWTFSFRRREVSCLVRSRFVCDARDGTSSEEEVGDFESVHDLAARAGG